MIYQLLTNEILLAFFAFLLLFLSICPIKDKKIYGYVAISGAIITLIFNIPNFWIPQTVMFSGVFIHDSFSLFFKELFLIILIFTFLISSKELDLRMDNHRAEYYSLLFFSTLGLSIAVSSCELITLYIALELTTMPLYILVASRIKDKLSSEAAMKYFISGTVASVFIIYGISLIFANLNTTFLLQFFTSYETLTTFPALFILGVLFLVVGFGFKIAAAPFHMWAPDVYEGGPTPVISFLSVAPKAAGIAILCRIFVGYFEMLKFDLIFVVAVLSLLSMIIGNFTALSQKNIKRMLAYSGIAQMGYILIGLTCMNETGVMAAIFYAAIYAITNFAAFSVVTWYSDIIGSDEIKDYAGMFKRAPLAGFLLLISLLSLAGAPPLVGFIGKFYLFFAAVDAKLYWLVVFGIITSVISIFYYFNVIRIAFFEKPQNEETLSITPAFKTVFVLSSLAVIVLGLYPPLIKYIATLSKSIIFINFVK